MPGVVSAVAGIAVWLVVAEASPSALGTVVPAMVPGEVAPSDTSGVSLTLVDAPSPGWTCPCLEEHLAQTQLRVWLVWQRISVPREFPGYTKERQGQIWDEWDQPVTVRFTLCPPETVPPETEKNCLASPFEMYVAEDEVDWLISGSAMEAVATSRGRLLPEACGRNFYSFRVRFSPDRLSDQEAVERILAALKDADQDARMLAARALGVRGSGHVDLVVPALLALVGDDSTEVREAVAEALTLLGYEDVEP